MKSPQRGSGLCLEGWGGDPGGRVLGWQSLSITVGLAEANLSTCKTQRWWMHHSFRIYIHVYMSVARR